MRTSVRGQTSTRFRRTESYILQWKGPWAELAWLSLRGIQVLSPSQRSAQELWLPDQLQLSWKGSRISFSTFYLEMCKAMGIYELPKIQSRGHKLEVHSHVCSDCSFFKKKRDSASNSFGRKSRLGDIYSNHFHQPFLHGTPNNIYSKYKMCTCYETTGLRQSQAHSWRWSHKWDI